MWKRKGIQMRYLIKIAYDGSKFFGFQRLNEEQSV
jgi:tRNA U38,U39,U40 pseudouridine synthase TruA